MNVFLNKTRRIVVVRIALSISLFLNSYAESKGDEANIYVAAIVDSVGHLAIEKDDVFGLCIGVAKGDDLICVKGFGLANVERDISTTPDIVFRIGSITKQFTAVAILHLIEESKIHLDDPLTKFFPDYPLPAGKATIQHLLQHTSGIYDFTRLRTYRRDRQVNATPDEVLDRFKDLPLDFKSGEKHQYCNSGYFLLGLIIEKVSEKSLSEFVEERLFKVTRLEQTYCDEVTRILPHRAAGYSRWGGKLRNAPHVSLKQSRGAGNMASTARDLLLWQQALIANQILNEESFKLMTTKGQLNNGKEFSYGVGVFIRKLGTRKVVRHGGGISGFRSDLAWYPESGYIISVLANCDHAKAPQISDRIARRLLPKVPVEEAE